jgi:hypothetical protein
LAIGDGEGSGKEGFSGGKKGAMRIGDRESLEFMFFFCSAEEIKVGNCEKWEGKGGGKRGMTWRGYP